MLTLTSTGLSAVAIAGIAVGAVAIIAVLVAFAVFVLYKRRRRPSETPPLPYAPEQPLQPPAQWAYEKATDSAAVEADWGTPVPRFEADHGAPRAFELPS
jgi:cell division protein FtsN